ncbi:MAG: class I SAM-dependent methyltransferase [Clostridia bacterium]|nr:class I SAM-dependent methyltransferase [Clostridia bacterium]
MNTLWSENVQGVMTLYLSRKLRFDDMFFEQYEKVFRLDKTKKLKILEIGCGPGALSETLRRHYPTSEIVGVDRDSNFIAFAKENVQGVTFVEGDATAIPFPDDTFDVTISHTVQEHIEPSAFWGEQYRVLKPGGVCLALSSRRGISCRAKCLEITEDERAFWETQPGVEEMMERDQVCRYPMSESEIPREAAKHGFHDISAGYAVIDLTPDDPKYPACMAEAMIESDRQCDLEGLRSTRSPAADRVADIVNAKYDERLHLYRAGVKQWDTTVSVIMILRGVK